MRTVRRRLREAAILLAASTTLAACATAPLAPEQSLGKALDRSCARVTITAASTRDDEPPDTAEQAAIRVLPGFSAQSVATARAIDSFHLLQHLVELEARPADSTDLDRRLQVLTARQELSDRLLRAMLQISAVASEANCENERGDLLKDFLQKHEAQRQQNLTVLGLVSGAVGSILAGGVGLVSAGNAPNVINIVGGAGATASGVAALTSDTSAPLRTPRNLLREIWDGPKESDLFAQAVWKFLVRPGSGFDGVSVREALVAQWREAHLLGSAETPRGKRRADLILGTGGLYDIDDLTARNGMLDMLESTVASMNQDIELLLHELAVRRRSF